MSGQKRAQSPAEPRVRPSLLIGTSTEYLGKRPWPRVIRQRQAVVVVGPPGVGKTSVAVRIAGPERILLEGCELQAALLRRVRTGRWEARLVRAPGLVLDDLRWLGARPGVVPMLAELVERRGERGRRTVLCQCDADGSIDALMCEMGAGSCVVIGLRFPAGKRARNRFARRACDELGVPWEAARRTAALEPWSYAAVLERIEAWPLDGDAPQPGPGVERPVSLG